MRARRLIRCFLIVTLVTGASAWRLEAQTTDASAAITGVSDAYVKATLAGDVKAITALYAEDAIEMPPDHAAIKGRQAIEAYYSSEYAELAKNKMKLSKFSLKHTGTVVSGDLAYDAGTNQQTLMSMDGKPMDETGKYVVLLKREGGAWKVSHAIYNRDAPPPMKH
jgi:uncharacterized protein (TIGR02246 family)